MLGITFASSSASVNVSTIKGSTTISTTSTHDTSALKLRRLILSASRW
jgi:hypothetical protein